MKKLNLIPLLFASLLFSAFAVHRNNTIADWHLKGKVKSIIQQEYMLQQGHEVCVGKHVYSFDDKGNITLQRSLNSRDSIDFPDSRWSYKYNNLNNKTEEIIYNIDGSVSWRTVYNYDKNNQLAVASRYHREGQLEERYAYKRNDKKTLLEEVSYNSLDSINNKTSYKYDVLGNETEEATDFSYIKWLDRSQTVSKYDAAENLLEYMVYDSSGTVKESNKNSYNKFDSAGNWTRNTSVKYSRDYLRKLDTVIFVREISYYQ